MIPVGVGDEVKKFDILICTGSPELVISKVPIGEPTEKTRDKIDDAIQNATLGKFKEYTLFFL